MWLFNLISGLCLPLGFAPFSYWWLLPLLLLVPLLSWPLVEGRAAFKLGFVFGAGVFLSGTYWLYISVHVFGGSPLWLAVLLMLGLVAIMALYFGLTAVLVTRLCSVGSSVLAQILVWVAAWVLLEWLRGWVLSGFPWISLGYGLIDSPLAGYAPLLGVYGVSLTLIVFSVLLKVALQLASWRSLYPLACAAVLMFAGQWLTKLDWTETIDSDVRVLLVQGSIEQDKKWLPESLYPTLQLYHDLTQQGLGADVIVWPEVSLPANRQQLPAFINQMHVQAEQAGSSLALGILDYDFDLESSRNSLLAIGNTSGIYAKRHLVPFGEYFPVPDFVREWMRLMSLPASDIIAGDAEQPLLVLGGYPVASSICYEDAFASEQRSAFPEAKFIVNVTNDAWFGDSIAAHHHLDIARMRSLESGRWQLRVANTGITAIIDSTGALRDYLPQFTAAALPGSIQARGGLTPYLATGDAPMMSFCLIVLVFFEIRRRRAVS
ncbi:MAG: apolipoprotein N-acyltransferase [Pseudomonadota bacterium]